MVDEDRRQFLKSAGAVGATVLGAGCNSNRKNTGTPTSQPTETRTKEEETNTTPENTTEEEETPTEEEPEINRPNNYQWDMIPGRNEELRNNLGQYVEGNIGPVITDHPAFQYSTETERDDHKLDFEALKLFRDSQFDILKQNGTKRIPWETYVEAFVNDSLEEEAKTSRFMRYDTDDPHNYTSDAWLNAGSFEQSLDMAHGLIASMIPLKEAGLAEYGTILREAYKRHQDYEAPLAWETNMGSIGYEHDTKITGLMYTPEDDKVRAFDSAAGDMVRTQESRRWHSEIQEWPIFNENNETFHPLLFHTDEWNRQNPGFENAKGEAVTTITSIATDLFAGNLSSEVNQSNNEEGYFAPTTGLTKQLTRSTLEYNSNDADFESLWEFANLTEKLRLRGGNYVLDTVEEGANYDGVFEGDIAIYEVEDKNIVDSVWSDQAGEYNNFGQVYDKLENPA